MHLKRSIYKQDATEALQFWNELVVWLQPHTPPNYDISKLTEEINAKLNGPLFPNYHFWPQLPLQTHAHNTGMRVTKSLIWFQLKNVYKIVFNTYFILNRGSRVDDRIQDWYPLVVINDSV